MTKSVKKFVILLVALLMCATVVFAACNKADFKPVSEPASATPESNGGIAVRYGEWLYYVNGYESNVSAENTYSNDVVDAPRIGSVVRIKLSDIEGLIEIGENKDYTSSVKTEKVAAAVREKAETVVPKIYYSGNTTTTQFTGIHIFQNRIYVTTPNDALTANGDPLTNQLVLMSFTLGGDDPQSHFTFTSNSAQIWLTEKNGKVIATYLMDNILHVLDVKSGEDTIVSLENDPEPDVSNTVSSVKWDETKDHEAVFFIDKFGSVCKLVVGETKYQVIIENKDYKVHEHDGETKIEAGDLSYTISSVNNGTIYYTIKTGDDTATDNIVMYWAKTADDAKEGKVALPTNSVTAYGWKENKVVVTKTKKSGEKTFYGIWIVDGATYEETLVLKPGDNDTSITIDKIEGDILYYTADYTSYTIDLSKEGALDKGTPYAKNLAQTSGWAAPDFINIETADGVIHYIISANTGSVTLTKFDPTDLKTTTSVLLTLTAEPEEDEE